MCCILKRLYDTKQQTYVGREILPISVSFRGEIFNIYIYICVLSNNVVTLLSWNQEYIHPTELLKNKIIQKIAR